MGPKKQTGSPEEQMVSLSYKDFMDSQNRVGGFSRAFRVISRRVNGVAYAFRLSKSTVIRITGES